MTPTAIAYSGGCGTSHQKPWPAGSSSVMRYGCGSAHTKPSTAGPIASGESPRRAAGSRPRLSLRSNLRTHSSPSVVEDEGRALFAARDKSRAMRLSRDYAGSGGGRTSKARPCEAPRREHGRRRVRLLGAAAAMKRRACSATAAANCSYSASHCWTACHRTASRTASTANTGNADVWSHGASSGQRPPPQTRRPSARDTSGT